MRVDLHTHSIYSKDAAQTPTEMIKLAKKRGLNGIAITDHNTAKGGLEGRKLDKNFVIPGIEVSSSEGHILGLGVTATIPRGLSPEETVEKIRDEGGIAVAAHPYALFRSGVGDAVKRVNFDAIEVLNAHWLSRNSKALKVCRELGKPASAGSDAHLPEELGRAFVEADVSSLNSLLENLRKGKVRIVGQLPSLWVELKSLAKKRVIKLRNRIHGL
jgi:predicted metal-dependent phosphoesterase TrpH